MQCVWTNHIYRHKTHIQNLHKWQFLGQDWVTSALLGLQLGKAFSGQSVFSQGGSGLPSLFLCPVSFVMCSAKELQTLRALCKCGSVETQVDYSKCGSDIDISGHSRPVQKVETCTLAQVQRQLTLPRSAGV